MKKNILKICLVFVCIFSLVGCKEKELKIGKANPNPNDQFGVDININIQTIDKYLGRDDVVYMDMRMLEDPANYCNIGGDAMLSATIKGFEVTPYPYLAPTLNLPSEVGEGYQGPTLYSIDNNGNYQANYKESLMIINNLFPKDKYIFLMCGGGGYASMTKTLLIALGYDQDKIFNIGGFWDYEGNNKLLVVTAYEENHEIKSYYAYEKLDYHLIDFEQLHKVVNQ